MTLTIFIVSFKFIIEHKLNEINPKQITERHHNLVLTGWEDELIPSFIVFIVKITDMYEVNEKHEESGMATVNFLKQ